ncbi:MAG: energy coupling factor transporter S component ThiW [Firmicutes bacterium]|nr:energy coupling factor transporter S component ThiW [Bacillota bacterium]
MKTRKLIHAAMLVAFGVAMSNFVYFPIGASKCTPVQHIVNVLSAVTLGPGYAVLIAFCISVIRNILGVGTLLAFPGSIIGAFLAGILYKKTNNKLFAAAGEIVGTGILGAIAAYPVAKLLMGKEVAAFFYVFPFLINTIAGSIIALLMLKGRKFLKNTMEITK